MANTKRQRYTLKDKYNYYKNKAESVNSINSQGKKISFVGRVACANKANSLRRRLRKNNRRRYY